MMDAGRWRYCITHSETTSTTPARRGVPALGQVLVWVFLIGLW